MNEAYAILTLGLIVGWCLTGPMRLFLPRRQAVVIGLAGGILLMIAGRGQPPAHFLAALFLPVGLSLPALVLQDALRAFGVQRRVWPAWEIAALLLAYLCFLAASMGAVAFDPYRFGYQPVPVAVLALSLVLYGWLRRDVLIAGIALGGQLVWTAGVGSSNYFDHVAHLLLAPVLLAALAKRLWAMGARKPVRAALDAAVSTG